MAELPPPDSGGDTIGGGDVVWPPAPAVLPPRPARRRRLPPSLKPGTEMALGVCLGLVLCVLCFSGFLRLLFPPDAPYTPWIVSKCCGMTALALFVLFRFKPLRRAYPLLSLYALIATLCLLAPFTLAAVYFEMITLETGF